MTHFCVSHVFCVLHSEVVSLARTLFHNYKNIRLFAPFFSQIPNAFANLHHLDLGVQGLQGTVSFSLETQVSLSKAIKRDFGT